MTDHSSKNDTELQALLADVADEKERSRLAKAWQALGVLGRDSCPPPAPGRELERIFAGRGKGMADDEMSDDELRLLAAAGIMQGTADNDTLTGSHAQDFIEGLGGDDQIDGGEGDDWIDGGEGDDTLTGGEGDDTLLGGMGDDTLHGGEGDDYLSGGAGEDTLHGGSGDDMLYGGEGDMSDVLTGGEGSDTYVFTITTGTDTVTDFNPEEDYLSFLGAESMDNINVTTRDGDTIITFGRTTVILEGVTMTQEEVWARRAT